MAVILPAHAAETGASGHDTQCAHNCVLKAELGAAVESRRQRYRYGVVMLQSVHSLSTVVLRYHRDNRWLVCSTILFWAACDR